VNVEMLRSSEERMAAFKRYASPQDEEDVLKMLSDTSNKEFPVFRDSEFVSTIAVGSYLDLTRLKYFVILFHVRFRYI
jgi:hypothetical protein